MALVGIGELQVQTASYHPDNDDAAQEDEDVHDVLFSG